MGKLWETRFVRKVRIYYDGTMGEKVSRMSNGTHFQSHVLCLSILLALEFQLLQLILSF